MGKVFQIQKNMESEPIIYGLKTRYFYIMFLLGILFSLIVSFSILIIGVSGSGIDFLFIVGLVFVVVGLFASIYLYLRKKSKLEEHKFKNNRVYISNRDLYEYL